MFTQQKENKVLMSSTNFHSITSQEPTSSSCRKNQKTKQETRKTCHGIQKPSYTSPLTFVPYQFKKSQRNHSPCIFAVFRRARKITTQPYEQVLLDVMVMKEEHSIQTRSPPPCHIQPLSNTTRSINAHLASNEQQLPNELLSRAFTCQMHSEDSLTSVSSNNHSNNHDGNHSASCPDFYDSSANKKKVIRTRMLSMQELLN